MSCVSIIGGGPCGFVVAKAVLAESPKFEVRIFERQETYGGIWNYHPGAGPVYRDLEANVPRPLIGFGDVEFPTGPDTYPFRQEVFEYIRDYSAEIAADSRVTVSFETNVVSVTKVNGKWKTEYIRSSGGSEIYESDFVLIATGHYDYPNWPDIPGLKKHPDLIHSRDYDAPEEYAGQKVLLIGNGRSGLDLAGQLLSHTAPITISRRRETPFDVVFDADPDAVIWKGEVTKVSDKTVFFADGSSSEFDKVIVCTGYLYEFPFLQNGSAAEVLHQDRLRLRNVYKHTFWSIDPTLCVIGMNKYQVPLPTAATQAAVIVRVWNGRIQLPPLEERLEEERQRLETVSDEGKFHDFSKEQDVDFLNHLWDWADEAPGGFGPNRWSEEKEAYRKTLLEKKLQEGIDEVIEARLKRQKQKTEASNTNAGLATPVRVSPPVSSKTTLPAEVSA